MPKVKELLVPTELRSLGVWPQGAAQGTAAVQDGVFAVERAVESFLAGGDGNAGDGNGEGLTLLQEQSTALVYSLMPKTWERSLSVINTAWIMVLRGDFEGAETLIQEIHSLPAGGFGRSLTYKKFHVYSLMWRGLGDASNERSALLDGLNACTTLPTASEVEATKWLHRLYDHLFQLSPLLKVSEMAELVKGKNFVVSYFNYLNSNGITSASTNMKDLQSYIIKRADSLISSTKFPSATGPNNYELEEFVDLVSNSGALSSTQLRDLVEKAIAVTYQSHIIMRAYIKVFISQNSTEELKAAVEVYDAYVHAFYEQNQRRYNDIISIIQTNKLILDHRLQKSNDPLDVPEFQYFQGRLHKLTSLLGDFYSKAGLEKVFKFDVDEVLKNGHQTIFDESLSLILSRIWATVAKMSWILFENEEFLYSEDTAAGERVLGHYKHSIWLHQDHQTVFQYARVNAIMRNVKDAYTLIRVLLQKVTNGSLLYFQSFHLLALILSVEENKDEAFKVIGFLVAEISEYIESNTTKLETREIFIQIKMTQLAIIQSLLGTEQALDSLPELFELFHNLYADSIVNDDDDDDDDNDGPPLQDRGHKRSLSLARTQTIQKIKSIRHKEPKAKEKSKTKAQILVDPRAVAVKATLQKIWLFASRIYYQLDLLTEAEEAIVESENSFRPSAESHIALALLVSKTRPELSLKEYDVALMLHRCNIEATVGYAHLVLIADEKKTFNSRKDCLAATARAKVLLGTMSQMFHGAHTTEIWWLLSQIYEKANDEKKLKNALWKCIELEETRPVRQFGVA